MAAQSPPRVSTQKPFGFVDTFKAQLVATSMHNKRIVLTDFASRLLVCAECALKAIYGEDANYLYWLPSRKLPLLS